MGDAYFNDRANVSRADINKAEKEKIDKIKKATPAIKKIFVKPKEQKEAEAYAEFLQTLTPEELLIEFQKPVKTKPKVN